jgi:phage gp16-like protein
VRGDMASKKINYRELSKTERLKIRKEIYRRWALSHEENLDTAKVEKEIAKGLSLTLDDLEKIKQTDVI